MSEKPSSLDDLYMQYAEILSSMTDLELQICNQRRLLQEMKDQLNSPEGDGGFGIDITAHAFKQVSERLETLAIENPNIYNDVFNKDDPSKSLLTPSNLKSFIISVIANARLEKKYSTDKSKSNGIEFRYKVIISKWSGDRNLEFTTIVENNHIKTGFFNWV